MTREKPSGVELPDAASERPDERDARQHASADVAPELFTLDCEDA